MTQGRDQGGGLSSMNQPFVPTEDERRCLGTLDADRTMWGPLFRFGYMSAPCL